MPEIKKVIIMFKLCFVECIKEVVLIIQYFKFDYYIKI